ncbi:hypothetical protein [Nostoc sp.]|uniref:hypothetical protein n=1 Tax=Nostoc sp. TaxID=1180 RepID=UPI002FFC1196
MSNNQVKIKCEFFRRISEFNKDETFDLKLELTNFTRDDLLSFLLKTYDSCSTFINTPPGEANNK